MAKQAAGKDSKGRVTGHHAQATATTRVKPARTGAELLDFLRSSPFVGEDFVIERDHSTGR